MLHRAAKTKKAKQEEQSAHFEHEAAVKRVYQYDRLKLAIARMGYYDSYSFRKDVLGNQVKVPNDFTMYGAVDEPYDGAKRVHCEVKFIASAPEDDCVGSCFLTHLSDDEKKNSEKRRLLLEVSVWDHTSEWRRKSYDALRDAAISGNQFCHFRIEIETITDLSEALSQLRERGYGPTIRFREFAMWPTITLPRAPDWGWKPA